MTLDQGAIVALILFAAGVVFNAGATLQMLRSHDKRIDANETDIKELSRVTAQLVGREGIQL